MQALAVPVRRPPLHVLAVALLVLAGLASSSLAPPAAAAGTPHAPGPAPAQAPVLLGTVNSTSGGWTSGVLSYLTFTFEMAPPATMFGVWVLGAGRQYRNNETGAYDFTILNESDFGDIAYRLTDGRDDVIMIFSLGSGTGAAESYFLRGDPDLVLNVVDRIRLVIRVIWIYPDAGGTSYAYDIGWEIWGHPVYAAFVPPTDESDAYLLHRSWTDVTVRLRSPGTVVLEWDGGNESMAGSGTSWHRNKTGVPNGRHTYRAWATDGLGAVTATAYRNVTLGVGYWRAETVDYGFNPSLAVDGNGTVHACYYDGDYLTYAARTEGVWRAETVDTSSRTGIECSLALDGTGRPHIAYEWFVPYVGDNELRYARREGPSSWTLETIERTSFALYTSIAVDPSAGEPLIAYYESFGRDLKLARRAGGAWTTEIVEGTGDVGLSPSLALDSADRPRIAYVDNDLGRLRHASWDGASWQLSTVDPDAGYGWKGNVALAIDASDASHVAYLDPSGLRFSTLTGGAWSSELVDPEGVGFVDLALLSDGTPAIAYVLSWQGGARYAVRDPVWRWELETDDPYVSQVSLAITPRDAPAVAHTTWRGDGVPNLDVAFRIRHAEIRIRDDGEFTLANGVTRGTGTPADPYVIDGWAIDALGAPGVWISGTTAAVAIGPLSVRSGGSTYDGILLEDVADVRIEGATVSGNRVGIHVLRAANVTVVGTEASSNLVGMSLEGSGPVLVAGNHLLDNGVQALDDGSDNAWDFGYPAGGNFWSDYAGADACRGPAQDVCTGPDGIGDTPYPIDGDSEDRYPIVTLNEWPVAAFTWSPASPRAGEAVFFDGTGSYDPDGSIVSYLWDWGDGTPTSGGMEAYQAHVFPEPGAYDVTLTVHDNGTGAGNVTHRVVVAAVTPLPLVSYAHPSGFRLPVPRDWTLRTDEFVEGQVIELVLLDPFPVGLASNILVDTGSDPTVQEDPAYLEALAEQTIAEIRAGNPAFLVLEAPRVGNVSGHGAVTFAVREQITGMTQRVAIVTSDFHDRYWLLVLTTDSLSYPVLRATFSLMLEGFEITLPGPAGPGSYAVLGIVAGISMAGAAVGIAVFLLSRPRRVVSLGGVAPANVPAPTVQAPAAAQTRFCPWCRATVLATERFCSRCGRSLPDPGEGGPRGPSG